MNVMMDDNYFMGEALKEAKKAAAKGEVPVGAVVVCGGVVIARAYNMTETLTDVTAHAEMQAITMAAGSLGGKYLTECTIYVTLEPCVMCAGAIGWAQFGKLVYGASDAQKGYTVLAPNALHPKCEVVSGVRGEECSALVSSFFKKCR